MSSAREKVARVIPDLTPEISAMRNWANLLEAGGVRRFEREAVAAAKAHALEVTRRTWLDVLERWESEWFDRFLHKKPRDRDYDEIAYVTLEIQTLRRALRIKPSAETVRQQTRDRVRAYRERQRNRAK
ncbi:MAG: hypothetical protein ACM3NI_11680 [Bacteroidota bacterium]